MLIAKTKDARRGISEAANASCHPPPSFTLSNGRVAVRAAAFGSRPNPDFAKISATRNIP
jgi:hypothetical protein